MVPYKSWWSWIIDILNLFLGLIIYIRVGSAILPHMQVYVVVQIIKYPFQAEYQSYMDLCLKNSI